VQRLLSIADVAQRLRPLVSEGRRGSRPTDVHRRLTEEVDALFRLVGLDNTR